MGDDMHYCHKPLRLFSGLDVEPPGVMNVSPVDCDQKREWLAYTTYSEAAGHDTHNMTDTIVYCSTRLLLLHVPQ